MTTLRKVMVLLALAVFVLAAAVFAYGNPGAIALDLGFVRLPEVSLAGAFATTFALGALFGMICVSLGYLKTVADKKRLQRRLDSAEVELSRLRSVPLKDAD